MLEAVVLIKLSLVSRMKKIILKMIERVVFGLREKKSRLKLEKTLEADISAIAWGMREEEGGI